MSERIVERKRFLALDGTEAGRSGAKERKTADQLSAELASERGYMEDGGENGVVSRHGPIYRAKDGSYDKEYYYTAPSTTPRNGEYTKGTAAKEDGRRSGLYKNDMYAAETAKNDMIRRHGPVYRTKEEIFREGYQNAVRMNADYERDHYSRFNMETAEENPDFLQAESNPEKMIGRHGPVYRAKDGSYEKEYYDAAVVNADYERDHYSRYNMEAGSENPHISCASGGVRKADQTKCKSGCCSSEKKEESITVSCGAGEKNTCANEVKSTCCCGDAGQDTGSQMKGIHNYSEIGKLKRVLLHRIGEEIEGLVPDNFERLLFDDIPYLKIAREEHDQFAKVLTENGVEVIYYVDETAKALSEKHIRDEFIRRITEESEIHSKSVKEAIVSYLSEMPVKAMLEKVIAGVKKEDIKNVRSNSLADYITSDYPYYMDPMPNLYFTRDPGACVGNGVSIHHMSTKARRREALLLQYMFRYNKDFAPYGTNIWYDYDQEYSIEGGDILVLSSEIVAIGLSQRTSVAAIERFAENTLGRSSFKKVLVFDIPKRRAFMHLDTVFTMVDYDKFTIHPEIEGPLQIFEIVLDKDGKAHFTSIQDELVDILKTELNLPAVELIRCGGDDRMAAQREQWNDGSNTLAIAPGVVVTYERNYVTNELLDKKGIKVLTIPSSELSRGRGGPRCMSCPVNREDL